MKKHIIIFLTLLLSNYIIAQSYTISGYIKDSQTGEYLIGANIYEVTNQNVTTTNNDGFYSLSFKTGKKINLIVSYVGYHKQNIDFFINNDTTITFNMSSNTNLETITVTAEKNIHLKPETSKIKIPLEDIKIMPSISGEADVIKVFQLMPGVQSGQEGASSLYVRGGSHDQNLYLIDDVPLFYVNHLGGFISVFENNAINSIDLFKGGFPARYGGRLSSVVDMRMKNGNLYKQTGEIKVGLISSKIFLEAPIKKNKTSFMLSLRRSNIDIFSRTIAKINYGDFMGAYTFYDFYGKIRHKFSDKSSIYLSAYSGRDKLTFRSTEEPYVDPFGIEQIYKYQSDYFIKWGNQMTSLRWHKIIGEKFSGNFTLAYSRFFYETENEYLRIDETTNTILNRAFNSYNSEINSFLSKINFDFYPNPNHKIKIGTGANHQLFNPGVTSLTEENEVVKTDTTYGYTTFAASELNFYIEDEITIAKRLALNIGFRAMANQAEDAFFKSFQPRINISFKVLDDLSFKASYAKMTQNIHLLSNTGTGIPTDIWLSASKELPPENSNQYVFNATYTNENNKYEICIESFYKDMNNLIEIKEGASYLINKTDWLSILEKNGEGRVYGLEFLLQKKVGKSTGWFAYTLSKNERKFTNINFGNYYPSTYDRRHDIAIVFNHRLNKKLSFSANWVFTSGNMITLATQNYNVYIFESPLNYSDMPTYNEVAAENTQTAFYYGGKNNFRLPPYHRLDISFTLNTENKIGQGIWQFSLYNAYLSKNIFFLYYKNEGKDLYKYTLFPIIPSISYSLKF